MRVAVGLKALYSYTSPHQATSPHPGPPVLIDLPPLSALAPMRWRTGRCVGGPCHVCEVMADCDRGDHAAADRDCKGPCKGPWWRKCGFYPPANPCRAEWQEYL